MMMYDPYVDGQIEIMKKFTEFFKNFSPETRHELLLSGDFSMVYSQQKLSFF